MSLWQTLITKDIIDWLQISGLGGFDVIVKFKVIFEVMRQYWTIAQILLRFPGGNPNSVSFPDYQEYVLAIKLVDLPAQDVTDLVLNVLASGASREKALRAAPTLRA
jgi:hypothetical protein